MRALKPLICVCGPRRCVPHIAAFSMFVLTQALSAQSALFTGLPPQVSLTANAGGAASNVESLTIRSSIPSLPFLVTDSSGGWLKTSAATGHSPTSIQVFADASALTGGTYHANLTISTSIQSPLPGSAALSISQDIPVTLTVSPTPLPTIASVVNAATFISGKVSPGELVTIFGTAIGPATAAGATTDPATGKLATTIGGVQVLFNGIAAPMIYASGTQVSAVVPYEMAPVASPSVWIKYAGQTSNAYQLTTTTTAPGLFTQNASGSGPGAILNQDNSLNGPGNRAAKGSIVQVFMTGEGQTSPPSVTGAITTATLPPPQVTPAPALAVGVLINGQPASYAYAGEAPGLVAGMMQLNVQIPANAPSGDLPITVSIGGNTSQKGVTVSVQ